MKLVQLVAWMSALLPLPCSAATYYVSNAGSDTNSGTTSSAPWATLAKVNATALKPGDTVALQRGSTWAETLKITHSGSAGHVIQYLSYGSNPVAPAITGANASSYAIDVNTASYIVLTHLTTAHALDGIHTNCVNNVLIDHVTSEYNADSGVLIAGGALCKSSNLVVQNSLFDNNYNNGIIDIISGDNIVVQNNSVHDNYAAIEYGAGIRFVTYGSDSRRQTNVHVLNNKVFHNGRTLAKIPVNSGNGIHMDTMGDGMVLAGNTSSDNLQFGIQVEWSGTSGTHLINGNTTTGNLSMGLVIYRRSWGVTVTNNVSTGNLRNCVIWGEFGGGDPVGMHNITFSNNFCYNPLPGGQNFSVAYGADNVKSGAGNVYLNNCLGKGGPNWFQWGSPVYTSTSALESAAAGAVSTSCSTSQVATESR